MMVTCCDATNEELIAFPTLWARQLERTPDAVAVVHEERTWTYRELDQLATTIARTIACTGVGKGDSVGLCVDRSTEAIAAMLGVMKLGAIFVPLDPEYPVDRLVYMVGDAAIGVILGHQIYFDGIGDQLCKTAGTRWIGLDDLDRGSSISQDEISSMSQDEIQWPEIAPDDLAYIMYTSGSTGKPKGVQIEHASLATYCYADIDVYAITGGDRTLQFSTLNFDIAIEEIFPPLMTGGTVVVRPRERANDRNELSSLIDRYDVTAVHLATAYWHQWVDLMVATGARVPASLRLMIVTGEKVSVAHYRRWQSLCDQNVLWCNAYGPTEATVSATVFIPTDDFDAPNMPIGKPIQRYEAFILDDDRNVLGVGETGQLFLAGPALARGYHNRPDLTAAAFIHVDIDGQSRRLYRTGDVARWMADGNIDFGGRVDHQIKLGSYRIEPAEIEAVINEHDRVLESLVTYDEVDGKKFLIAYLATGNQSPSASDVAGFLRGKLPVYMVPTRYVFVDAFPKTINGKIDRRQLPPPSTGVVPRDEAYTAARNDLEQRLVDLWQDVLNVPQIGIHDDFFLLGGSSLLVTQVIARLTTDMKIELPVRDFFANPTIATVARHIAALSGESIDETADQDASVRRNLLPIVDADYFASGPDRLYAVRYQPRSNPSGKAFVLCHSLGHEYARGYRNLQQLAVQMCLAGHEVLRFDYASTGNSTGDCKTLCTEKMLQNVRDAKSFLISRTGASFVGVIGLRIGGAVAAMAAGDFDQAILWDPVVSGHTYLKTLSAFHDDALTSLNRFPVVRDDGGVPQLYGQAMPASKRNNIASIHLSACDCAGVVITRGYDDEPSVASWLASQANVHRNHDVIAWDDVRYAESAFSSPESFHSIIQLCSHPEKSHG